MTIAFGKIVVARLDRTPRQTQNFPMREHHYYVYILASQIGGTLYIGVTNDLIRRVYEHKTKAAEGFTRKYGVDRLVYFEYFDHIEHAIHREKRLKKWPRAWKIALIEKDNPNWDDLYPVIAVL
jgi:putative endonuclease